MAKLSTLQNQYLALAPGASRLKVALTEQLTHILATHQISLGVPLESRVKAWSSIAEKIERKARRLTSVDELDDLVGIRLILLFQRDVDLIHRLIGETFLVLSAEDTASRLTEKQFGYKSHHYIVRIPEAWEKVPSFAGLQSYKVEIQLRTLSQHIWAAASHKLQYKHEESVPLPLRRAIYRVSALLETVDLEFTRVLDDRDTYIADQAATQHFEEKLNVDSVQALLTQLLPAENLDIDDQENYADVLIDLLHFNIDTSPKLRDLLTEHKVAILEKDTEEARSREADEADDEDGRERLNQRLERGVFFTHVGLTRQALCERFGDEEVLAWQESRSNGHDF
jgi:ppGpp synthetase/RelA/SpoT-type nucleotidyltranferase